MVTGTVWWLRISASRTTQYVANSIQWIQEYIHDLFIKFDENWFRPMWFCFTSKARHTLNFTHKRRLKPHLATRINEVVIKQIENSVIPYTVIPMCRRLLLTLFEWMGLAGPGKLCISPFACTTLVPTSKEVERRYGHNLILNDYWLSRLAT